MNHQRKSWTSIENQVLAVMAVSCAIGFFMGGIILNFFQVSENLGLVIRGACMLMTAKLMLESTFTRRFKAIYKQVSNFNLSTMDTTHRAPFVTLGLLGVADEVTKLCQVIGEQCYEAKLSAEESRKMAEHLREEIVKQTAVNLERSRQMESSSRLMLLGEMAAGIAHEINNPIAIVQGRVELLEIEIEKRGIKDEKISGYFKSILDTCQRITSLVKSMRNLGRDGSSDPFESFKLGDLCRDVLSLAEYRCLRKGIKLKVDVRDDQQIIKGRRVELSQALANLLNNAVDAVHGQENAWIGFSACVREGLCEFKISDSGKIIDPSVVERLMSPFFTNKALGEGLGQGLSMASRIANDHGGKIFINEAQPNTEFVLITRMNVEEINAELIKIPA